MVIEKDKEKKGWGTYDKSAISENLDAGCNFFIYRPMMVVACIKCKKMMYENEAKGHVCGSIIHTAD